MEKYAANQSNGMMLKRFPLWKCEELLNGTFSTELPCSADNKNFQALLSALVNCFHQHLQFLYKIHHTCLTEEF